MSSANASVPHQPSQCVFVCVQAFQKELGKRTSSIQALKRSARELMDTGRDDTAWVKVQLQELSNRWDTVCALSVSKQTRLQQAVKQVSGQPLRHHREKGHLSKNE